MQFGCQKTFALPLIASETRLNSVTNFVVFTYKNDSLQIILCKLHRQHAQYERYQPILLFIFLLGMGDMD